MRILYYLSPLLLLCMLSCGSSPQMQEKAPVNLVENPAAEGFDETGSDAKAIEIADEVMKAMGGRANYDATRFLSWDFFGFRTHIWDKQTGDVRIANKKNGALYLMNIHTLKGKAYMNGEEIQEADSLAKMMEKGKAAWINDAYWLVMPFKLKDSGVTLTYIGEDTTQAGVQSDVLELIFKGVGVTPQNRYRVWVEKSPRLITQWAFYRDRNDEEPGFITPWINYEQKGNILLSGDRGQRKLTDIKVADEMDPALFAQP